MFGPETFIVRVAEDAMAPRGRAGDYIWIDPDEPGRATVARNPPSARFAGTVSPPRPRTMLRAMASPGPPPPVSRLRDASGRPEAHFTAREGIERHSLVYAWQAGEPPTRRRLHAGTGERLSPGGRRPGLLGIGAGRIAGRDEAGFDLEVLSAVTAGARNVPGAEGVPRTNGRCERSTTRRRPRGRFLAIRSEPGVGTAAPASPPADGAEGVPPRDERGPRAMRRGRHDAMRAGLRRHGCAIQ